MSRRKQRKRSLSKSIENWKAGKTEEGAGQLEEYFEKMAVKLAAIHKGRD